MKKKLTEGTSNFGNNGIFPLYCGITYDELEQEMEFEDDIPERDTDEFGEYQEKWFNENSSFSSWVYDEELDSIKDEINDLNNKIENFASDNCWNERKEDYSQDYYEIKDLHVTLEPGYYEGFCIKVENQSSLDYIENKKLKHEIIDIITKGLKEIGEKWHLDNLQVYAHFNNGEVIYTKVDEAKKKRGNIKSRTTCGDVEKNIQIFNKGTSLSGNAPISESGGHISNDKRNAYNHGLVKANRLGKPVVYGYTTRKFNNNFIEFDEPFEYDMDDNSFRKRYGANDIYVAYPSREYVNEERKSKNLQHRRVSKSIIRNMLKGSSLDDPKYVSKLDSSEFEDLVDTWSFQYYDDDNVNLYSDLNSNKEYCIVKDGDNVDVEFEEDVAIKVAKELDADKVLLVKYKGIDKNGDYYGEETETIWEASDEIEENINKNFKLTHI